MLDDRLEDDGTLTATSMLPRVEREGGHTWCAASTRCSLPARTEQAFGIPDAVLPKIVSSSKVYGPAKLSSVEGVPVAGIFGIVSRIQLDLLLF